MRAVRIEALAAKGEYCSIGNYNMKIREGTPAAFVGDKELRAAKPAIRYTFAKISAVTGKNRITNIPITYTVKSVRNELNALYGENTFSSLRMIDSRCWNLWGRSKVKVDVRMVWLT